MEITGLASIVGSTGVSAIKGGAGAQNNAALLASLPDNTVLRGVVQSRGANNTITLSTEQGMLTLQTDVFLKRGVEIALKVEQRAHESLMRIISVGGQSLTKYLEGTTSETTDAVARSSTLVAPAVNAETGEVSAASSEMATEEPALNTLLRGVFLAKPEVQMARIAALNATLQAQLEQATTGTSLQVRVLSIQIPSSDGKGFIPLAAHAAMLPPPVTGGTGVHAGSYAMTPAQRMAVEPLLQTALQNQQAASASLPVSTAPATAPPSAPPFSTTLTPAVVSPATTTPAIAATLPPSPTTASPVLNTVATTAAPPPASVLTQPNVVLASLAEPPVASPPVLSTTLPTAASPTPSPSAVALPAYLPTAPTTTALSPAHSHTVLPVSSSPSPTHFTATVVQSAARELTVHSDLGTLKLFVTTPLPRGTLITFDLQQVTSVRGTGGESLETDFKALETLVALQHPSASANTPNPAHILPRAGAAMGAEILFLLSALKGGDVRSWIGEENIKRLEALKGAGGIEKSDLLSRLSTEFASLKTIPEHVNDGQWRSVLIPIYAEGQVRPLQLFYKKQKHKDNTSGTRTSDHFMVEIDLSQLGKMQLDGLVQKQGRQLQFDLIIRTERTWEEAIRAKLRDIYQTAQSISGFNGILTFRQGAEALMPPPIDNTSISAIDAGSIIV